MKPAAGESAHRGSTSFAGSARTAYRERVRRDRYYVSGRLHRLTRREWVRLLGATAAAGLAPPALATTRRPSCVVRPQQTEGPYFLDERLNRSDIRSDPGDGSVREGVPLELTFNVYRIDGTRCAPLAGAIVDVWHCDALGEYSGFSDIGGLYDTRGKAFLRGYQLTDEAGVARFTTIFPGWYPGRTVHIHFKVRTDRAAGRRSGFTSQLYFDDELTDVIHAQEPYARKGKRTTRNADDWIYRRGGQDLHLTLTPRGRGYAGTFELGLEM